MTPLNFRDPVEFPSNFSKNLTSKPDPFVFHHLGFDRLHALVFYVKMFHLLRLTLLMLVTSKHIVSAGETATAVAAITAGFVSSITVTFGGAGYIGEPVVTLSGGVGTGATAKAILNGDRVGTIVVLSAGSGYAIPPTVSIQPPTEPIALQIELVPKLSVQGSSGSSARIEWAAHLGGPWQEWTNVLVSTQGTVIVDLTPAASSKYYRAVPTAKPSHPHKFAWVPPGTFVMGSPTSEPGRLTDEAQRTVNITKGFWICIHEVTQAEFEDVMGYNPSFHPGDSNCPVEMVSWNAAVEYCRRLTERERTAGRIQFMQEFRLPTEAEWEYAARSGLPGPRYGTLDSIAWHSGNSGGKTHAVMQKEPNPWGLYDVLGNVFEWVHDWKADYKLGLATDPKGPSDGPNLVLKVSRGGSYKWDPARTLRFAARNSDDPTDLEENVGFRVLLGETD